MGARGNIVGLCPARHTSMRALRGTQRTGEAKKTRGSIAGLHVCVTQRCAREWHTTKRETRGTRVNIVGWCVRITQRRVLLATRREVETRGTLGSGIGLVPMFHTATGCLLRNKGRGQGSTREHRRLACVCHVTMFPL